MPAATSRPTSRSPTSPRRVFSFHLTVRRNSPTLAHVDARRIDLKALGNGPPPLPLSPTDPTRHASHNIPVSQVAGGENHPTSTEPRRRASEPDHRASDGPSAFRTVSGGTRGLAATATLPKRTLDDAEPGPAAKRPATEPLFFCPSSDNEHSDGEYLPDVVPIVKGKGKGKGRPKPSSTQRPTQPPPKLKRKQAARGTSKTKRAAYDGAVRCSQVDMRLAEFRAGRIYARDPSHELYDAQTHFSPQAYAAINLTKNGVEALGPVLEEAMWEFFSPIQKRILAAQTCRDQPKCARLVSTRHRLAHTRFSPSSSLTSLLVSGPSRSLASVAPR